MQNIKNFFKQAALIVKQKISRTFNRHSEVDNGNNNKFTQTTITLKPDKFFKRKKSTGNDNIINQSTPTNALTNAIKTSEIYVQDTDNITNRVLITNIQKNTVNDNIINKSQQKAVTSYEIEGKEQPQDNPYDIQKGTVKDNIINQSTPTNVPTPTNVLTNAVKTLYVQNTDNITDRALITTGTGNDKSIQTDLKSKEIKRKSFNNKKDNGNDDCCCNPGCNTDTAVLCCAFGAEVGNCVCGVLNCCCSVLTCCFVGGQNEGGERESKSSFSCFSTNTKKTKNVTTEEDNRRQQQKSQTKSSQQISFNK